jgi:hypothetical protein
MLLQISFTGLSVTLMGLIGIVQPIEELYPSGVNVLHSVRRGSSRKKRWKLTAHQ